MIGDRSSHIAPADIAAYVDRRLASAERERVEAHLADCQECRDEVLAVSRLTRKSLVARRSTAIIPFIGVAAAAVIAVVLMRTPPTGSRLISERMRADTPALTGELGARIAIHSPEDGNTVATPHPMFIWASVGGPATYRLTVSDQDGAARWTIATSDTSATLPDSVHLDMRTGYFWYVDALRSDGRSATTGARRFVSP